MIVFLVRPNFLMYAINREHLTYFMDSAIMDWMPKFIFMNYFLF